MNMGTHTANSRRRGRYLVGALLALALLTASVVGAVVVAWPQTQPRSEDAAPSKAPERWIACVGFVDVESGVLNLSPVVSGRVAETPVREGAKVRAGALLLRLEDDDARADVEQAQASLQTAQTQLAEARKGPQQQQYLIAQQQAALAAVQHELRAARLVATRKRELLRQGDVPSPEVEAADESVKKLESAEQAEQAKLDSLQLNDPKILIQRAEASVRARQAVLDKALYALREHALYAPADGQVLRMLTQRGDLLGPSRRQPAMLFLADEPRIVRAEIDQEFVPRVAVGQRAQVTNDATDAGPTWSGRVIRLGDWFAPRRAQLPDVTEPLDVRTLECIIQLDSPEPAPRIGERVRVKILE